MRTLRVGLLLAITLLAALALRLWGLGFGLPYVYHADEPLYVNLSLDMLRRCHPHPGFFNYPSLFFYVNTVVYGVAFVGGWALGRFDTPADLALPVTLAMGVTYAPTPWVIVLGRAVAVFFGVATVGLVYVVAQQLWGRRDVGLLAAALTAILPTTVSHSRTITPDTLLTFVALAAFLATVWVYRLGRAWHYALAGLCVGLTASTKYNGVLIALPLLAAALLRLGPRALADRRLYLALGCCALGFLGGTPFALLDWRPFLEAVRYEGRHYASGHAGMEGNTLAWYLGYMWHTAAPLYLLALLGLAAGLRTDWRRTALLASFPLGYLAFIASFVVRNDRTLLPLTPFAALLASWGLAWLWGQRTRLRRRGPRLALSALLVAVAVVTLAWPATRTVVEAQRSFASDNRELARTWLEAQLPPGAHVALEAYSPFVDPTRYRVLGVRRLIDHPYAWYAEQGVEYVIASAGMYGRFYDDPQRYGAEIAQYDALLAALDELALFDSGAPTIRVYRLP